MPSFLSSLLQCPVAGCSRNAKVSKRQLKNRETPSFKARKRKAETTAANEDSKKRGNVTSYNDDQGQTSSSQPDPQASPTQKSSINHFRTLVLHGHALSTHVSVMVTYTEIRHTLYFKINLRSETVTKRLIQQQSIELLVYICR